MDDEAAEREWLQRLDDHNLADAIRKRARLINLAIAEAVNRGLFVKVDVTEILGAKSDRPVFNVKISKDL